MRHRVLRAFGAAQRPVAWAILVGGVVTFIVVLLNIVRTGEAKLATLLGAVLIWSEGFQSVSQVENELDSEGSAER